MKKKIDKPLVIGIVGTGYGSELHGNGYINMVGVPVRLKTVCGGSNLAKAEKIKEKFGYEIATLDYMDIINDPEIDVVDITVNQDLHIPLAIKAMRAGKDVICEKPLTGYLGDGSDNIGNTVRKSLMYDAVLAQMDELKRVIKETGR